MRRRLLFTLLVAAVGLAACTTVPVVSKPQVVRTLGAVQPPAPDVSAPVKGAEPRAIVAGFLANNASSDSHHLAARAFLTPEANNRWSDTTVTVISDTPPPQLSIPDANNKITVTGSPVGSIDQNGIYAPLQVVGSSSSKALTFGLVKVNGEWRIDQLQNGLLITYSQFQLFYQSPRTVYFYDQDEQHLVPDPRYTALRDSGELASWLMTQLVQGARPELQVATTTELPAQADPRRVTVTPGTVMKVEIPGASQLAAETRERLATQVALTLEPALNGGAVTITDGGRAVLIPPINSVVFTADTFASAVAPPAVVPALYYLNPSGAVIDANTGIPLSGPLGTGTPYKFTSIGLASLSATTNTDQLLVAGTVGAPGQQVLFLGATTGDLHQVAGIHGDLTRPAWAPDRDEVWVAAGTELFRTSTVGAHANVAERIQITNGSDKITLPIVALRLSPEGSRVAIVLQKPGAPGEAPVDQIWLGSVVRASGSVQVSNLTLVSPAGVTIADVAWNDALKLFAVGHNINGGSNVYEVQSDGSLWTPRGIPSLPAAPDSITVAESAVASVSAQNAIWVQTGGLWVSPRGGTVPGTNPIYVE